MANLVFKGVHKSAAALASWHLQSSRDCCAAYSYGTALRTFWIQLERPLSYGVQLVILYQKACVSLQSHRFTVSIALHHISKQHVSQKYVALEAILCAFVTGQVNTT